MTRSRPRPEPPRRAQALLARLLPSRDRDAILGDLAEEFRQLAERRGEAAAREWYLREVRRSLLPALGMRWTAVFGGRRRAARDEARTGGGTMRTMGTTWTRETGTAARALARSPAFTATAVLTLALGIGASAAIFAVVDSVLLRPLSYPEPHELVYLDHPVPGNGEGVRWGLSIAGYFHLTDGMTSLEALGGYFTTETTLTGGERPERLPAVVASTSLLRTLGARAEVGRVFDEDDDEPGAAPVALISHRLWSERFGRDPGVVGSTIHLGGNPTPVVGVLEPGFHLHGGDVDVWLPFRMDREAEAQNSHWVRGIGRLGDGATAASAEAEMLGLTRRLPERFPQAYSPSFMESSGFTAGVRPLRDIVVGEIGTALWILLAGVAVVLLVACANVANLFLVRTEGRMRALALRRALGADRLALATYFVGEGLLLAGAAGVLGLLLAHQALAALIALSPPGLPRLDEVGIGPATVLVTLGLVVLAGLVFGALPLARARGTGPAEALAGSGTRTTRGPGVRRVRDGLVAAQVALALVLVTASGLMLRSYLSLQAVDPGFDPVGVTTFALSLPATRYPDADAVYRAHRTVLDELSARPGVTGVGAIDGLPIGGPNRCIAVTVEDAESLEGVGSGCPQVRFVAPGYFETMGIALEAGRTFEHRDNDVRTGSLLVSRAMAEHLWPGFDPIGRGVRLWGAGYYRVIGVVADIRDDGLDQAAPGILYFPIVAAPGEPMPPMNGLTYVVRAGTGADPVGAARSVVAALDPDVPLASVRSMEQVVARSMIRTTFTLLLLGIAGALGLLLGIVGMYAVVAYTVSQRTAELGVRIALGAGAGRVRTMVLGHAGALAAIGVAVGLAASLAGTRLLESMLFGVSATDVPTLAGASVLLLSVSMAAAWLPARRATRVDPVVALREE